MEEIRDAARWAAIQDEWDELWRRVPEASPFQSPAWLMPWWNHFGGSGLYVLALRKDGRLIGLAPFFISQTPGDGKRELLLVGTGNSDRLDILAEPGEEERIAEAVFAQLNLRRELWNVCDFQELGSGSPLWKTPAPSGWREERAVQSHCPILPLPPASEALDRSVPASMLRKLCYYRRRAGKTGNFRIERAGTDTLEELLGAFFRLHFSRWTARGEAGMLSEDRVERFHREAAQKLLALGLLRLYGLRLNGEIRACLYGFRDRSRMCFYLSGFDPAFAHLSPGVLLLGHAIEEAMREGAQKFDFLRGQESYKYRWGATDELNHRRRCWRETSASVC